MSVGMMDIRIVGDTTGVEAMLSVLDTAFSTAGLVTFLTGTVGPYLQQRARNRFESEGDDVSGRWPSLRPATVRIREDGPWQVGGEHPINVRTHQLEEYITGSTGQAVGSPDGSVLTFPAARSMSGNLQQKVKTAQKGATQKGARATVPRPVLGVNERDLAFIIAELAFYIQTIGNAAGRA